SSFTDLAPRGTRPCGVSRILPYTARLKAVERDVRQRHSDRGEFFGRLAVICAGLFLSCSLLQPWPAIALSEIQREEMPLPPNDDTHGDDVERGQLPPPEMQPEPEEREP